MRLYLRQPASRDLAILIVDINTDVVTFELCCGDGGRPRAAEGIEDDVINIGKQFYKPQRQVNRKSRTMVSIRALGSHVNHVGRIHQITPNPIRDVLAESAGYPGLVPGFVGLAQIGETVFGPIADRHHHSFLVHLESATFVELEQSFPGIPKSVGPLAWVRFLLVPHEFLSPQPALFAHLQDQVNDVSVALAIYAQRDPDGGNSAFVQGEQKLEADRRCALIALLAHFLLQGDGRQIDQLIRQS